MGVTYVHVVGSFHGFVLSSSFLLNVGTEKLEEEEEEEGTGVVDVVVDDDASNTNASWG